MKKYYNVDMWIRPYELLSSRGVYNSLRKLVRWGYVERRRVWGKKRLYEYRLTYAGSQNA